MLGLTIDDTLHQHTFSAETCKNTLFVGWIKVCLHHYKKSLKNLNHMDQHVYRGFTWRFCTQHLHFGHKMQVYSTWVVGKSIHGTIKIILKTRFIKFPEVIWRYVLAPPINRLITLQSHMLSPPNTRKFLGHYWVKMRNSRKKRKILWEYFKEVLHFLILYFTLDSIYAC